jgi:NitT/TauT family transport system substrate-binding protein
MRASTKHLGIVVFCLSVSISSLFFACNRPQPVTPEPIKAKLAILTWVGYGPFFVAQEKGLFKKYGLDLDLVKIEELGARHSAFMSGEVQFSISTYDLFATESAQGLPAVCFIKLDDSYGADGIVAKKGINSVKDLKGKTIAFEKANPSHFFLIYQLEKEGLSIKDVTPKYMTAGDAGAAFVAGNVDAAVTWEPWLTKASQTPFGHILITSKDSPGLILDVLLANKDFAAKHPDAVKGLLKAWFEALDYCKNNPDDANAIMAKGLGIPVDEFKETIRGVRLADYAENRRYFGLDNPGSAPYAEVFKKAQNVWISEGLIKNTVPVDQAVDTSFLRDLYK